MLMKFLWFVSIAGYHGNRGYKTFFSCSTQLSMKFKMLIDIERAKINGIFRFELLNKNKIMSSFKSSRDIQKKEGGPDSCFG